MSKGLLEQCLAFEPDYAVMADETAAEQPARPLAGGGFGRSRCWPARRAGTGRGLAGGRSVMAAIVGAAGLLPTLAAARAGKRVLLANKEALVMAGPLFMAAVRDHGAELLPIDSEHNAVFQCLPQPFADRRFGTCGVRRILLTGSGGPFRATPLDLLPDDAGTGLRASELAHGAQDFGGFRHHDEQGVGGDRGACWLFGAPPGTSRSWCIRRA
jgi:1-deoxy-D-xylulose-5-phosphate reductoisomerase